MTKTGSAFCRHQIVAAIMLVQVWCLHAAAIGPALAESVAWAKQFFVFGIKFF